MEQIIKNTIQKVNKNTHFDEIKKILKLECEKVEFEINNNNWNEMLARVIVGIKN
jgi:hypothetical protein